MLPLLKLASDGNEHQIRDAIKLLTDQFNLSDAERKETLPSGGFVFDNRVGWARTYLKKAGLIRYPKETYFQITDLGQKALNGHPEKIDVKFLRQFPGFIEFQAPSKDDNGQSSLDVDEAPTATPEELLASGYLKLRNQLESDVLARVKVCSSDFFERMVVRLLTAMGYGGSLVDAGKAIGKSGDGGVDGVIKEDKLGLELLFIQAKKWDNTPVGRPEIQKFVGALHGQKAKKGVFITTSTFTKEARDYAEGLDDRRVILIDGAKLAGLMFDYGIGVSTVNSYDVKSTDSDFFDEEETTSVAELVGNKA